MSDGEVRQLFLRDADVQETAQATQSENADGESGQEDPSAQETSNEFYIRERHKYNDRERRTGLRSMDRHSSWREVYAACEVRGEAHE